MAGTIVDPDRPCRNCAGHTFYADRNGRRGACKACALESGRRYRANHPEAARAAVVRQEARRKADGRSRLKRLKQHYGITVREWEELFERQGRRCAICRVDAPRGKSDWHVDHDHVSGYIRGILCHSCNTGIGMLGDDPVRAFAAARYLLAASAGRKGQSNA